MTAIADPTETQVEAPFWMPNDHPSWCWVKHSNSDHPDDRWHQSDGEFVEVTLEPPVLFWAPGDELTQGYRPQRVEVYLRQQQGQADAVVKVGLSEEEPWVRLTASEARHLAVALTRIADLADSGGVTASA